MSTTFQKSYKNFNELAVIKTMKKVWINSQHKPESRQIHDMMLFTFLCQSKIKLQFSQFPALSKRKRERDCVLKTKFW